MPNRSEGLDDLRPPRFRRQDSLDMQLAIRADGDCDFLAESRPNLIQLICRLHLQIGGRIALLGGERRSK